MPDDKEVWRMAAVKGVSDDGCSYIVNACKEGEEVEVRANKQPNGYQQRTDRDIPLLENPIIATTRGNDNAPN